MKIEEYINKREKIKQKAFKDITKLMYQYAEKNNSVKIGDIITDHIGSIKVEKIFLYRSELEPSFIYSGKRYTKFNKPFKSGEKTRIYQINLRDNS